MFGFLALFHEKLQSFPKYDPQKSEIRSELVLLFPKNFQKTSLPHLLHIFLVATFCPELPTPSQERAQQLLEIEVPGSRGEDSNMVAASQKG